MASLTLPAVIGAAIVDAINPCAFAVLILLTTTVLATGKKKKALHSGLAFTGAIYIAYFLMGLGLFSAIQAAGLTRTFYIIVTVLAFIVGLLNIKDYFWYGKGFLMEVPISWRPKMKKLIAKVTSAPGAFVIGILVSFFLLPCTSGPYIVILGLLAKEATRFTGILYLLLYNLIFILPMLIITYVVYKGISTTEKLERIRKSKLRILHLIAGLIILAIGIVMLVMILTGNI
jgi:cytochrome c biogenesis protein CcdA